MSGCAPPSTTIWSARLRGASGSCATSQAQSSSGSATVAERPIVFSPGASLRSRARPSDRRSPRLETTSECSSSKITVLSRAKKRRASFEASSSATCSGVVSRMSGGSSFCRCRLWTGVSPVRVSSRIGGPSRRPAFRGCGGCRRRAPSAARRRACAARRPAAGLRDPAVRHARGKIDEARQEAGERLAGAGRRDEEHRASRPAPSPAARSDAAAAPSRAWRTSAPNGAGRSGRASAVWTRAVIGTELEPGAPESGRLLGCRRICGPFS